MNTRLLPHWYVVAETPVGTRWIYDVPDELRGGYGKTPQCLHSDGGTFELVETRSRGSYASVFRVVADHRLGVVTWTTKAGKRVVEYLLTDPSVASEAFPVRVTPDQWASNCRAVHDDTYDPHDCDCAWCGVRNQLYTPILEGVSGDPRSYDFSGHVRLPGNGYDEHPDHPWNAGPGGELYEPHLLHLLPGTLPNVRERVAEALQELPHVTGKVYSSGDCVSLTVRLPLDHPRERWVDRLNVGGTRKLKGQKRVVDTTVDKRIEFRPPWNIAAPTKAEAVATLAGIVADYVGRVERAHVVWCTSCDGVGYTVPDPE